MPSPKISVIVPVYNTEKYLRRCVDSILAQTYTDFELLLVNDGSTDGSGAICDEYATRDQRVRVFHKNNGGVSSARNLGLDNACGEWITFADSDDYVYPNWLTIFNFDINNDYNLLCQGIETSKRLKKSASDEGSVSFGINYTGNVQCGLEQLLLERILGYPVIKTFKRKLIEARCVRFDTMLKYREDEKFILDYVRMDDKMASSDKIGYYYFMPDYQAKYNELSNLELSRHQYQTVLKLRCKEYSELFKFFLNDYIDCLLSAFATKSRDKNDIIHELHILSNRHRNLCIFPPLKWALQHIKLNLINQLLLTSFLNLKKLKHRIHNRWT